MSTAQIADREAEDVLRSSQHRDRAIADFATGAARILASAIDDPQWRSLASVVVRTAAARAVVEAQEAFQRGDTAAGARRMRLAIEWQPHRVERRLALAVHLQEAGDVDGAVGALIELAEQPDVASALLVQSALLLARAKRPVEGHRLFDRAVAAAGGRLPLASRQAWAAALLAIDQPSEAAAALKPAARAIGKSAAGAALLARTARLLTNAGSRAMSACDARGGEKSLRLAIRLDPAEPRPRFALAAHFMGGGNASKAVRELDGMLACAALSPHFVARVAKLEADLGLHDRALAHYTQAVALAGDEAKVNWRVRAAAYHNTDGRCQDAADMLAPAIDHPDFRPEDRIFLARIRWRLGQLGEALELVRAALAAISEPRPAWEAMKAELELGIDRGAGQAFELSSGYMDQIYRTSAEYELAPDQSVYLPVWRHIPDLIGIDGARVVDAGCGPGQFASFLLGRRPDIAYTGVDFSDVAIEQARARCRNAHFVRADLVAESMLADLDYDILIALEVLEHIDNDRELIAAVPSGRRIIVSLPNFDAFGHVRFFRNADQINERFGDLIRPLRIEPVPLAAGSIIFLVHGVRS